MSARLPSALVDLHRRSNRATAESWAQFADHRARLTELVLAAGAAGARVAVLGAGNGNDLDIERLAAHFGAIHLIDLDAGAVTRARERQPPAARERIVTHAPVDASGALKRLAEWRTSPPTLAQLAGLPASASERALEALGDLVDRADVVVSACLLSQVMWTCREAMGEEHVHLRPVSLALAVAHLRVLLRLARPGGTALLVADTLSSESYPVAEAAREGGTAALLDEAVAKDLVFLGTSRALVHKALREDRIAAPLVASVHDEPPWLWPFASDRLYLVYATAMRRRAADAG
jgi:hypothetical protein